MKKEGRFWIILTVLLLTVAIVNFIAGLRMGLIVMPLSFSILFALNYLNMKLGGKFTIKKEQHKKRFLIILIILLLIVTVIAFIRGMGMNVIIVPLAAIIYSILSFVRLFVFEKKEDKK